MKNILPLALFLLLGGTATMAQTKKSPETPDFWQEFQKMQQQMIQSLRDMAPNGAFQWDTTFTWSADSLLNGGGFSGRFFSSPFGQDTAGMQDFWDANPSQGFQWSFPPGFMTPEENDENSVIEDQGDGLLPEERLRKEGEEKTDKTPPEEKSVAPEPAKKPKIKTIRI